MPHNSTRGYIGYRGRRSNRRRSWLIAVLLLVTLAAAAFLFAQRYRVYRADGTSYYALPWSHRSDGTTDTVNTDAPALVIERGENPRTARKEN